MAKKRQEEPPKGAPAWMTTFSDLMNLLLTFFVLLFSMSSVNQEQFELVIASLQSSFSILPSGGATIGDGEMVSSGISQLPLYDIYYNEAANSKSEEEEEGEKDLKEEFQENALAESEEMAETIEKLAEQYGIIDQIEVDFNAEYVMLNLSGTLLFDSGKSELKSEVYPLLDKVCRILQTYSKNMIEIEGHTDNVPMHRSKYADNSELSCGRALSVYNYLISTTNLDPTKVKYAGRGEYVPVADNSTAEGRAKNRRVEIRIYHDLSTYE